MDHSYDAIRKRSDYYDVDWWRKAFSGELESVDCSEDADIPCGINDTYDYNTLLDEYNQQQVDLSNSGDVDPSNLYGESIKRLPRPEYRVPTFLAHETHPSDSYLYAITVATPQGNIVYHCQDCYDAGKWVH